MGASHGAIGDDLKQWIEGQPVFFVATAPLSDDGHVNLSPKGIDALAVIDPHRVAYLDLTGSGAETIAHLRENGRITLMLSAFRGSPRIVRLYGRGRVHLPQDDRYRSLASHFSERPGVRSIIEVEVERVQNSCGFGVPEMELVGQRTRLTEWAAAHPSLDEYRARKNARSLDGLPALDPN